MRAADQRAQLRAAGFAADATSFALDGHELRPDERCDDAWIYYCVQKTPAEA